MANPKEALLWSIAFPGFGQFINGQYTKGFIFIILEVLVNVLANFNQVIILSFHGEIMLAIEQTNYQWLMFYPCLYFFSMWDAWKNSGGGKGKYSFLPFVFSAYFVTLGLIFSSIVKIAGVCLGPVWLPMLSVLPGLAIGMGIQKIMVKSILKKGSL